MVHGFEWLRRHAPTFSAPSARGRLAHGCCQPNRAGRSVISVGVSYRPVRIGWCVRRRSIEQLRKALKLTHVFWGGIYNPVIPVDDLVVADAMVRTFRLDLLYPVAADDPTIDAFVKGHPYLSWPGFDPALFREDGQAAFVDLFNLRNCATRPHQVERLAEWEAGDELADLWLATFGDLPSAEDAGHDYRRAFRERAGVAWQMLLRDGPVDIEAADAVCIGHLTTHALEPDVLQRSDAGFFIGDAASCEDLTAFWNLRACGHDLIFFDPAHASRLSVLAELYRQHVRASSRARSVDLWMTSDRKERPLGDLGPDVVVHLADSVTWNGLNQVPPFMRTEPHLLVLPVDESGPDRVCAVPLGRKPFSSDYPFALQYCVASFSIDSRSRPPFLPEANREIAHVCGLLGDSTRSEWGGMGVICHTFEDHRWLREPDPRELALAFFSIAQLDVKPSSAGLVAARLISQMGGHQGCRVFKIRGVRELIRRHGPEKSFTRGRALDLIGNADPADHLPRFAEYEDLSLGSWHPGKLKPADVFTYLLRKGVFRAGLELLCPHCGLEFWRSLDDVRNVASCEYCGKEFGVAEQLKDRDWRYRRSGLFGRDDQQQGAIPVALVLQQLHTLIELGPVVERVFVASPSMEIKPRQPGSVPACETDFVLLTQDRQHGREMRAQLVLGECKSAGSPIEERDARNLAAVAGAFPRRSVQVFIVFAKPAPFSEEELALAALAQDPWEPRVIVLSDRELEPFRVLERVDQRTPLLKRLGGLTPSLVELAEAMVEIYPVLRPGRWPGQSCEPVSTKWTPVPASDGPSEVM